MLDSRLKQLKEAWNQLDEMPAWNDGNKDISRYIKGEVYEIVKDKLERGYTVVKEVPIQDSFAATILRRYSGRTLCALVYFDNRDSLHHGEFVGEFFWHNDGSMWKTESVAVKEKYQGMGIAFNTYVYMIENYMHTLYSDTSLTGEVGKGSFDIWVKLGKYFPFKYVYNEEENMLEAVDGFTRGMMGDENIRFVVSTEAVIEDTDEDTGEVTESLVELPTDDIRRWLTKNTNELIQKIHETYTHGYNTYIEDYINIGDRQISVNIQKKLLSGSPDIESALYYNEKEEAIYISADALVSNLKDLNRIKGFVIRGIWHELTHVSDPNRLSHKQDLSSYDAYVNSPREFPAFARMFIEELRDAQPAVRNAVIRALQVGKRIPVQEIQTWYTKLTPENKEKFKAYCLKELAAPNA